MKTISRWFLVFSFLLGSHLFAQPAKKSSQQPRLAKKNILMNYGQFQRLQKSKKIIYLTGIREFLVRADFSKDARFKTSLLSLFIERSYAVDEESVCIFAGFLQNMKQSKSGRWYCPKPDRGDCPEGQVPCNPLVFAKKRDIQLSQIPDVNKTSEGNETEDATEIPSESICVGEPGVSSKERFKNATEECASKSDQTLDAVVAGVDQKAWDDFNNDITAYCEDPFPFNKDNCITLTNQLNMVNYRLNKLTNGVK